MQKFNQVIMIMEENMIVIRDPKTFCFNFGWPKDVEKNLKHEHKKQHERMNQINVFLTCHKD